eukprot:10494251-Lingulodinium_polyedra.AAC.1
MWQPLHTARRICRPVGRCRTSRRGLHGTPRGAENLGSWPAPWQRHRGSAACRHAVRLRAGRAGREPDDPW